MVKSYNRMVIVYASLQKWHCHPHFSSFLTGSSTCLGCGWTFNFARTCRTSDEKNTCGHWQLFHLNFRQFFFKSMYSHKKLWQVSVPVCTVYDSLVWVAFKIDIKNGEKCKIQFQVFFLLLSIKKENIHLSNTTAIGGHYIAATDCLFTAVYWCWSYHCNENAIPQIS